MKKTKKQTLVLLTWLSVILCGCPGGFVLVMGLMSVVSALGGMPFPGEILGNYDPGFLLGVGLVCLSGTLLLVPIILVVITVTQRPKQIEIQSIEPTGASKDEPIPPTG
jgi:hypothetical protein